MPTTQYTDPLILGANTQMLNQLLGLTGTTATGTSPATATARTLAGTVPATTAAAYNPAATLTGTTQAGSGAYGAVPAAASPQATQVAALTGNIAAGGQLSDLSRILGEAALPGYAGITTQASQNIANELAGVLSPDVIAQINQQSAERGINVGAGSPNVGAAALRAMGLTSQQLQAQGQTDLTAAMARAPNVSNMLLTPEQVLTQQQLANTLASAPNPAAAAAANLAALKESLTTGQKQGTVGGYTITGGGGGATPTTPTAPTGVGMGGGVTSPTTPWSAITAPTTTTTAAPAGAADQSLEDYMSQFELTGAYGAGGGAAEAGVDYLSSQYGLVGDWGVEDLYDMADYGSVEDWYGGPW